MCFPTAKMAGLARLYLVASVALGTLPISRAEQVNIILVHRFPNGAKLRYSINQHDYLNVDFLPSGKAEEVHQWVRLPSGKTDWFTAPRRNTSGERVHDHHYFSDSLESLAYRNSVYTHFVNQNGKVFSAPIDSFVDFSEVEFTRRSNGLVYKAISFKKTREETNGITYLLEADTGRSIILLNNYYYDSFRYYQQGEAGFSLISKDELRAAFTWKQLDNLFDPAATDLENARNSRTMREMQATRARELFERLRLPDVKEKRRVDKLVKAYFETLDAESFWPIIEPHLRLFLNSEPVGPRELGRRITLALSLPLTAEGRDAVTELIIQQPEERRDSYREAYLAELFQNHGFNKEFPAWARGEFSNPGSEKRAERLAYLFWLGTASPSWIPPMLDLVAHSGWSTSRILLKGPLSGPPGEQVLTSVYLAIRDKFPAQTAEFQKLRAKLPADCGFGEIDGSTFR